MRGFILIHSEISRESKKLEPFILIIKKAFNIHLELS